MEEEKKIITDTLTVWIGENDIIIIPVMKKLTIFVKIEGLYWTTEYYFLVLKIGGGNINIIVVLF